MSIYLKGEINPYKQAMVAFNTKVTAIPGGRIREPLQMTQQDGRCAKKMAETSR